MLNNCIATDLSWIKITQTLGNGTSSEEWIYTWYTIEFQYISSLWAYYIQHVTINSFSKKAQPNWDPSSKLIGKHAGTDIFYGTMIITFVFISFFSPINKGEISWRKHKTIYICKGNARNFWRVYLLDHSSLDKLYRSSIDTWWKPIMFATMGCN